MKTNLLFPAKQTIIRLRHVEQIFQFGDKIIRSLLGF